MMTIKGSYDLLNLKGVDVKLQHLFSNVIQEDEFGRLIVNYYDSERQVVDREVLSISNLKFSSGGATDLSIQNPSLVRSVFISDSLANLIFFLNGHHQHFNLEFSAFLLTGSALDKSLLLEAISKYPSAKKHYCLYGNSLLGKIKDCKVQHWINGNECLFRIDGDEVTSFFENQSYAMKASRFTLRDHLRQLSVRQTVNTKKPKNKAVENFCSLAAI